MFFTFKRLNNIFMKQIIVMAISVALGVVLAQLVQKMINKTSTTTA